MFSMRRRDWLAVAIGILLLAAIWIATAALLSRVEHEADRILDRVPGRIEHDAPMRRPDQ